jgi:AcrR family transcriptional regulator
VFWTRGYQATSLEQITEATGVNKPSLYAAFGDKGGLFRAALDRYHALLLGHARAMLAGAPSAREGLRAWLTSFVGACSGASGRRGCFSVNTAAEATLADPDVAKRIARYNETLEGLLRAAIERGRTAGELRKDLDPAAAARLLLATQTGLMILARDGPPAARTRATMDAVLASLEG